MSLTVKITRLQTFTIMRGVHTSSPGAFTRMGSLNSNENGYIMLFSFKIMMTEPLTLGVVFRSTRTGMTKVCGYSRDAYTSKLPFLDDGESLVPQTTPTTGSSVWESRMIGAKSDAESEFRKKLFFSRANVRLLTYILFLIIYCPKLVLALHNVKPLSASRGCLHLIVGSVLNGGEKTVRDDNNGIEFF